MVVWLSAYPLTSTHAAYSLSCSGGAGQGRAESAALLQRC